MAQFRRPSQSWHHIGIGRGDDGNIGLEPEGVAEIRRLARELPDRTGATVLVSSHLLGEVEQVADHAGLLCEGRLVMQDPLADLLDSDRTLLIRCDNAELALRIATLTGLDARAASRLRIAIRYPAEENLRGTPRAGTAASSRQA
ncbi:MAG: hypothetical protein WBA68_08675 [Alteraurantiacibacter sp.]